jgi:coproporphyrinogen III oxidase
VTFVCPQIKSKSALPQATIQTNAIIVWKTMKAATVINWGVLLFIPCVLSWAPSNPSRQTFTSLQAKPQRTAETKTDASAIFFDFADFLKKTQSEIIQKIEEMDGSEVSFTNDTWGVFDEGTNDEGTLSSGGITRVFQGGNVIEKGACSFTLIRQGILTAERAAAIRSRKDLNITAGDVFSAAALSIVLHSRSPMVPTFRSDVRVFFVQSDTDTIAWFGGGADLTPYYLFDHDTTFFHNMYRDLCENNPKEFSYQNLKELCDHYFYLVARAEHRGTGGIFFDDMEATPENYDFVKGVANAWMPSWLPIVEKRRDTPFTEKQKQWQLLRRGRYLEFNLLYDRGVKFGLANTNPRVEGVMVSAPPLVSRNFLILLLFDLYCS